MDIPEEQTEEPLVEKSLLEWDGAEYLKSDTKKLWYVSFGVLFVLIIALFLYTRDFFGAGFGVILAICLFYYKSQNPKNFHYRITQIGLYIDDRLYPFDTIHAFSIDTATTPKIINFVFAKKYLPELSIVLEKVDPITIKDILGPYLPEVPDSTGALIKKAIRFLRLQ